MKELLMKMLLLVIMRFMLSSEVCMCVSGFFLLVLLVVFL